MYLAVILNHHHKIQHTLLALSKMYFGFLRHLIEQDHLEHVSSENYKSKIVAKHIFNF